MKRKIINLALILITLVSPFIFTCCSDDDDQNSTPLIGTWVDENLYFVKYNSDGTGYDGELNNNGTIDFIDENFKWSTNGNNLTIIWEDNTKEEYTYEIRSNILTVHSKGVESSWADGDFRRVN